MTVGIVSPGAMGSAVGACLLRGGERVVATLAGRSERTGRLARAAGIELLPDLAAVVGASDVVLSIGPPDQAAGIARSVRRAGETLLVDMNAVSPGAVRAIGADVDGSISGPPPGGRARTRVYLSGPRAAEVAALPFDGVEVIVVGPALGLASAVKMATASVYKGTTAVLAHALFTARANGVLEEVLDNLGELAAGAGPDIAITATKAARYVGEMREIAATQAAAGLTPALFEAMATVYADLARTAAAAADPEDVTGDEEVDAVLDALSRAPAA